MAQHLHAGDRSESFRGSPLYMVFLPTYILCTYRVTYYITSQAPEIMSGHAYDAKVDLWSVGVILYGNDAPKIIIFCHALLLIKKLCLEWHHLHQRHLKSWNERFWMIRLWRYTITLSEIIMMGRAYTYIFEIVMLLLTAWVDQRDCPCTILFLKGLCCVSAHAVQLI